LIDFSYRRRVEMATRVT